MQSFNASLNVKHGFKMKWRGQAIQNRKMRKTHFTELETSWNHSLTLNTHWKTLPNRLKPSLWTRNIIRKYA